MSFVARLSALLAVLAVLATGAFAAPAFASAPVKHGKVTATNGSVRATLSYHRTRQFGSAKFARMQLLINSAFGAQTLTLNGLASYLGKPILTLTDLTGDGVPDAIVDTYSGGAHCCSISAFALSGPAGWAPPFTKNWADLGYQLKTLPGSALPVLVSDDPRFTNVFSSFADSVPPISIWSLAGGKLADVTRNFPDQVRADAGHAQHFWRVHGKQDPEAAQSGLAGWIADLTLLGDTAGAKAALAAAAARGDLNNNPSFVGKLGTDLMKWGYTNDPYAYGLTTGIAEN